MQYVLDDAENRPALILFSNYNLNVSVSLCLYLRRSRVKPGMRTAGTGTPFGQSQSPSEKSAMRGNTRNERGECM